MRTQTAREKAEAHVACIRHEYPNPQSKAHALEPEWYCVLTATRNYFRARGECNPLLKTQGDSRYVIAELNDAGRFEEAWLALADHLERA